MTQLEPVEAPQWLIDLQQPVAAAAQAEATPNGHAFTFDAEGDDDRRRAYAMAAIDGVLLEIAHAARGTRNATLNKGAFRIGQFVATGAISDHLAVGCLRDAARDSGLLKDDGHAAAEATIRSGLNAGKLHPANIPDGDNEKPEPKQKRNSSRAEALKSAAVELEPPLPFIWLPGWQDKPIPVREWAVLDRVPARNVTLLSGEGSIGKTLLAQQLAVATCIGKEWLGTVPDAGPVIMVGCEDDAPELLRRFEKIAEYYNIQFRDLPHLHPLSLAGEDGILALPDRRGLIQPTKLFERLMQASCDIKPKITILDNAADVFGGNEIERAQVRQFIGLLRQLCMRANTAVCLTSHPSLAGLQSGSGISGSTAWHNSVRARMFMKKPKADGEDDDDSGDRRVLEVMKNNYGPAGETVNLRWKDGLFLPEGSIHWLDKKAAQNAADELFIGLLTALDSQGRSASDKRTAPNYAPAIFAKDPKAIAKGIGKSAFVDAMARLFAAKRIHVSEYGRPSRPASKLALGAKP